MSEARNGRGALFTGGVAAILASTCCRTFIEQAFHMQSPAVSVALVIVTGAAVLFSLMALAMAGCGYAMSSFH